jgi:hypothetical protein
MSPNRRGESRLSVRPLLETLEDRLPPGKLLGDFSNSPDLGSDWFHDANGLPATASSLSEAIAPPPESTF